MAWQSVSSLREVDPLTTKTFEIWHTESMTSRRFSRDHRVGTYFEKVFGFAVRACYTDRGGPTHPQGERLELDHMTVLVFLSSGKVLEIKTPVSVTFRLINQEDL